MTKKKSKASEKKVRTKAKRKHSSIKSEAETSKRDTSTPLDHTNLRHYPQCRLQWKGDQGWMPTSQAILLTETSAEFAIVFVHGWGGSAGGSWGDFSMTFGEVANEFSADAFILDYPSRSHQVPFCAAKLREFLIDLVQNPTGQIVNPSIPPGGEPRSGNSKYRKIVIVAHSMGAVISRRALLDIERDNLAGFRDQDYAKIALLFFAPAHSGSKIPIMIANGLGLDFLPGAKLLGSLLQLRMPSLADLAEGSQALEQLANHCTEIRMEREARNASSTHLRAQVVHAQNDRVVVQAQFDRDSPFKPEMHQNHRTICKPNSEYATPIEELRQALDR